MNTFVKHGPMYATMVAAIIAGSLGCSTGAKAQTPGTAPAAATAATPTATVGRAVAVLRPAPGQKPEGTVVFENVQGGIKVTALLKGLKPNSEQGFHIHEFGDCSDLKGKTPGAHFNPDHYPHGAPTDPQHHAGSFGNIKADAKGVGKMEMIKTTIALEGERGILGRAVVVHAGRDDLKSQPSGNAGDMVSCGVIGVASVPK